MGKKTRKNLAALEKAAFATNTLDEFQEIVDEWLYVKANYKAYVKSVAFMQKAPLNVVISGVNYSKVNRKAKQGDVIAFAQGVKNKIKKGEFYEAVESPFGTIFLNEEGDELKIYTGDGMIPVVYENVYKNKDGESPLELVEVEHAEPKRKFKVGDKVRVTSVASDVATTNGLSVGDVSEVIAYKSDLPEAWPFNCRRPVVVTGERSCRAYFEESALELTEEKTPNELRAEIIQRAKDFVEKHRNITMVKLKGKNRMVDINYIVNAEKRTVVVLLKCALDNKVEVKGIAKCSPHDVFNADIGKAIALGRALGKDVSEFENAVQPTKVVPGQVIVWKLHEETVYRIDDKTGNYFNFADVKTNEKYCDYEYREIEKHTNVVDDTNAQYGGEKL